MLAEDGLLDKTVLDCNIKKTKRVDYGWLFQTKLFLLKKAFELFDINKSDYVDFKCKNSFWLDDYALFMSINFDCNRVKNL